jgi:hypothetical protein
MKDNDRRSRRIALVADSVMNPAPGEPDLLAAIAARDWGVIGLPPERLGRDGIRQWIAGVGDQVREFCRHGMTVVAVLDRRDETVVAGLERNLAEPPAVAVPIHACSNGDVEQLCAFLDANATRLP